MNENFCTEMKKFFNFAKSKSDTHAFIIYDRLLLLPIATVRFWQFEKTVLKLETAENCFVL